MKKILLTGSNGQLGQSILKVNNSHGEYDIFATDIDTLDITNKEQINTIFDDIKPDIVINTAAYTNVDGAEREQELATKINGLAPGLLAQACKANNALMVHLSTDYVFDGKSKHPYVETDRINPINAYGTSKLKGEQSIAKSGTTALIVRTSWLFSEYANNFIKTMLRLARQNKPLKVIDDQYGCPTYAGDLAEAILFLCGNTYSHGVTIFHITNSGYTTWHNLASQAFEYDGVDVDLTPVTTQEYGSSTNRPLRSILSNERLNSLTGYIMPHWKEGLKTCITNINNQQ